MYSFPYFSNMSKKVFYPLLILIIPLAGMAFTDEFNWSLFDFIIMGTLLLAFGIGIQFIRNRVKPPKIRILLFGLLILLFLFIWIELAVGIFGTPFAGS